MKHGFLTGMLLYKSQRTRHLRPQMACREAAGRLELGANQMIAYYHVVRDLACIVADAVNSATECLNQGRIEHEPDFTGRMLGAVEHSIRNKTLRGVHWHSKTLTERGPNAQESKFGADFIGVFSVRLPELKVSKGFLGQAKLVRGGSINDRPRLNRQCELMLSVTPASFVFLYGNFGVRVFPALSVLHASDPMQLYFRSARRFFEEHFQSFIGDRNLSSPTEAELEAARQRCHARSAFLIAGENG